MMKLALYIAKEGRLLDHIINIGSGAYGYSHCELVFGDGVSFSSSSRDGGCRFKNIIYDHKWVLIELPNIGKDREQDIRWLCSQLTGTPYDYLGILFYFVIPLDIQDRKKWWCSEICGKMIGLKNYHIPPNKLAKIYGVKRQSIF